MGEARRTLLLVNLSSIMERADEALLPAVYREVGEALHSTTAELGALTLCRSFVQAACYPLAAYAAVRYDRARVVALGAFLWAAATFLVAVSDSFPQIAVARGMNGIGLALVTPAIQSLVADYTDDNSRGSAFGWLQLTGNLGSLIGARYLQRLFLRYQGPVFMHCSFESLLSSFAPPIVGYLAEHAYGYKPITYGVSIGTVERDKENAAALGKALYTAIAIPMFLCCFIYSLLYQTYPRDRERARMDMLITSDLQQIEMERSQQASDYYNGEDVSVIDNEYGEEELDADDDEKTLMLSEIGQSAAAK